MQLPMHLWSILSTVAVEPVWQCSMSVHPASAPSAPSFYGLGINQINQSSEVTGGGGVVYWSTGVGPGLGCRVGYKGPW